MSRRRHNPVVRMILRIAGSFFSSFSGLGNLFGRSHPKRRRNVDFDKAGNEVILPPTADRESTANINRATRERDLEVINAIRQEKKMLRRNDEEAQQYRKSKEQDNLAVSRGDVINHLAAMQRKAANKKKDKAADAKVDHDSTLEAAAGESQKTSEESPS